MSTPALEVSEDLRTHVEQELRRQFDERTPAEEVYGAEFTRLWRAASDHASGGKLIRPLLLIQMHRALAGDSASAVGERPVMQVAALIEQLHFAFLLHDDVIDGDVQRRGAANLIGTLRGEYGRFPDERDPRLHWARSSALLMGDLLLAAAVLGFARVDLPEDLRGRLLDLLDHAVTETVAGEHGDVGLADGTIRPDLQTILAMTTNKTATYSFELPLRCGAVLAGASGGTEAVLGGMGRRLGLAYQLQDDLLSTFGDALEHGKDPFSDLREAKQTAIIAYARMTSIWPLVSLRFGAPDLRPDEGVAMREHLRDCGAEVFVRGLIDDELAAVDTLLSEAGGSHLLPESAQNIVRALLQRLKERRA